MATAAAVASSVVETEPESPFRLVPTSKLVASPLNPRKHFDQGKLEDLAATMGNGVGIIEPLVVRPNGAVSGKFEIVAGERRWRAATIAKLDEVPVLVRILTDAQVLELMVIENDQREDINPLEEGDGFKRLMTFGFDIDKLATRIGRSRKYIYDRVKLLDLIEPARELLLEGRITAAHAILLARLTPEQQEKAIGVEKRHGYGPLEGALFEHEDTLFDPGKQSGSGTRGDKYAGLKVRSVRELDAWIAQHCRFEPLSAVNQELFPQTIAAVEEAEKVVSITYNHHVDPDAKDGNTQRIYGPQSWKRADGLEKSKTCDESVLGVVVVGPRRGEAFRVCVDKDCDRHWGAEKRAKAKAATSPGAADRYRQQRQADEARWERERQAREAREKAWKKAEPELKEAVAKQIRSCAIGKVILHVVDDIDSEVGRVKDAMRLLDLTPAGPEETLRIACLAFMLADYDVYRTEQFTKAAKAFGVDVPALLKKVQASAPKAEKAAKPKASAKKKTAKKKAAKR